MTPLHIRNWRTEAKALQQQDITNKEAQLKKGLGTQNPEKELWNCTARVLAKYTQVQPGDVYEIALWVKGLQKRFNLQPAQLPQLHELIDRLHPPVANGTSGAFARGDIEEWLDAVPQLYRTAPRIGTLLVRLNGAGVTPARMRKLWSGLGACIGVDTLCTLMALPNVNLPNWFDCALQHYESFIPQGFWMYTIRNDEATIQRMAVIVYDGVLWQGQAINVNTYAKEWADYAHGNRNWLKLFTMAQWIDIRGCIDGGNVRAFLDVFADMADGRPARRAQRASPRTVLVNTTDSDLGAWIHHHREVVVELIASGYPADVLLAMYRQELEHRDIVACTWFRQQQPVINDQNLVAFKIGPNVHGFVTANTAHLAERHLYKYFDFNQIKDQNSFHPHGTDQNHLAALGNNNIYLGNGLGWVTSGNYCFYIYEKDNNPYNRWVRSLFPDIPQNHRDYFTRDKLERVQVVIQVIGNANLPELNWRNAPRAAR